VKFEERYSGLNPEQRLAVDTLDGPVMVVAGPGTGKTELLSVRVANILRKTDALPQNILCLTFTESGAFAMRERLAGLIGPEAYKVAVHTFHSFGSEVINQNGEFFYNGADFRPADELSAYHLLHEIFEKLPHDNPLAATMNGDFVHLRQTQSTISHLKKSGLSPDELQEILGRNNAFVAWLQPKLQQVFGATISKKMLPTVHDLIAAIDTYKEESYALVTYEPLCGLFHDSLTRAVTAAEAENSTKPLTAWKKEWCEKRSDGKLTLKDEKRSKRLAAVGGVYYDYLVAMQEQGLYDFDDMILRTVHALEVFDELRLNLQEQYQYVLVDEFQDTNDAQMRIVWNLTNNPASEGRPNIMVVGDDDQAIYRFQGADISNILQFSSMYRDVTRITLKHNYRSASKILELARRTIVQAEERLEHSHDDINKQLTANHSANDVEVSFVSYKDQASEFSSLANSYSRT
jgi:DNA helicase-2/ATP-dependent DNA helicase PcrA